MTPGIFHAPSDTIEVYDLGSSDYFWSSIKPGFTALAHPSSLSIGRTHGVFVLREEPPQGSLVAVVDCSEVLQKPSVEIMKAKKAVTITGTAEEIVYTDSSFFFDHSVSRKFLKFYSSHKPLLCEIDAYGDFLQALGPNASSDYIFDVKNVRNVEESLIKTRKSIYDLLKGENLNVIVLNSSKFYHLGTVSEYIHNFCQDAVLRKELDLQSLSLSKWLVDNSEAQVVVGDGKSELVGCVVHSIVSGANTRISSTAVVEYCEFDFPVVVQSHSLINSCSYLRAHNTQSEPCFVLPADLFMHGLPLFRYDSQQFTTLFMGANDDVKRTVPEVDRVSELEWFGRPLSDQLCKLGWSIEAIFPDATSFSLWHAKLFPVDQSISKSFLGAYKLSKYLSGCYSEDVKEFVTCQKVSMFEATTVFHDSGRILEYRNALFKRIKTTVTCQC